VRDSDDWMHFSVSARHRARTVFAAILLMLHWAAPSLRPFDPLPKLGDTTPAYSTALNAAVTGTLPRVLARIQTLDSNAAKPSRQFWQGSGPNAALAPAPFDLGAPAALARPGFVVAGQDARHTAHPFDARAPPVA
jgi:hypothetical protein